MKLATPFLIDPTASNEANPSANTLQRMDTGIRCRLDMVRLLQTGNGTLARCSNYSLAE